MTKKSALSQPIFKSVASPAVFSNSFQNFSGAKDSSQYSVNGVPSGGKGPTTYAAVKQYANTHSGITFGELQAAFPDYMAKPGFGKMIRRFEEVGNNEWGGHRFNKHPILLSDGTKVAVSTQWTPHNMRSFIEGAKKLGIDIQPL